MRSAPRGSWLSEREIVQSGSSAARGTSSATSAIRQAEAGAGTQWPNLERCVGISWPLHKAICTRGQLPHTGHRPQRVLRRVSCCERNGGHRALQWPSEDPGSHACTSRSGHRHVGALRSRKGCTPSLPLRQGLQRRASSDAQIGFNLCGGEVCRRQFAKSERYLAGELLFWRQSPWDSKFGGRAPRSGTLPHSRKDTFSWVPRQMTVVHWEERKKSRKLSIAVGASLTAGAHRATKASGRPSRLVMVWGTAIVRHGGARDCEDLR